MDTEAVLLRAGAIDQTESEDSMPSQSDLADFFRALPRGQKQSPAISRLAIAVRIGLQSSQLSVLFTDPASQRGSLRLAEAYHADS